MNRRRRTANQPCRDIQVHEQATSPVVYDQRRGDSGNLAESRDVELLIEQQPEGWAI